MYCSMPHANKLEDTEVDMNSAVFLSGDQPPRGVPFDPYFVEVLVKDASQTFFNEFDLISHQINSFDPPFDRLPPFDMNVEAVERFCKRFITNLLQ